MLHSLSAVSGMVSAPHHLAAQAGVRVLREGGNAVEAAVATAAALAVVYPHMNALGGDCFFLIAEPGQAPIGMRACGGAVGLADADRIREAQDGSADMPTRGGLAACTVAGAIGGWAGALHHAAGWGRPLPLSTLLEDAIRHARDGFPVTGSQSLLTAGVWSELAPIPGWAAHYGVPVDQPDPLRSATHTAPAAGTIWKQPDLARTLEWLSRAGLDDFYRGDLARTLASGLERSGSLLRLVDLERWEPAMVRPLSVSLSAKFGGGVGYNMPPPTQGVSSLMILGLADRLGLADVAPEEWEFVHILVEATKRAFLWRDRYLGDPQRMSMDPMEVLTEKALTAEAAAVNRHLAAPWPVPPSVEADPKGDTVWFAAADHAGRVVSCIQSIYWEFGSGVIVPETGVLWQNRGAGFSLSPGPNQIGPERLPRHTLNPALARLGDGRTLAYGTMGGEGQPQTQAALFSRHVVFGQDLQAAVSAPRWLLGRTWKGEATGLKLESRFSAQLMAALGARGHSVEAVAPYDDCMGHAGAICVHPSGRLEGATDPRADGICAGL